MRKPQCPDCSAVLAADGYCQRCPPRAPSVRYHYYLIAHKTPLGDEALLSPAVVASVTCDPRFLGALNPHQMLTALASKMGLIDFEISTAEAHDLPGHQLGLPFPRQRAKH